MRSRCIGLTTDGRLCSRPRGSAASASPRRYARRAVGKHRIGTQSNSQGPRRAQREIRERHRFPEGNRSRAGAHRRHRETPRYHQRNRRLTDLGITTFVGGTELSPVQIDTRTVANRHHSNTSPRPNRPYDNVSANHRCGRTCIQRNHLPAPPPPAQSSSRLPQSCPQMHQQPLQQKLHLLLSKAASDVRLPKIRDVAVAWAKWNSFVIHN